MSFARNDLERLADIVTIAADQEIMPRFRSLGDGAIREKTSALDLVTDADEAAEAAIKAAVAKAFPKAVFVGEESVEKDRGLLNKIAGADMAIIIDPVDGTSNFAWGLPLFGVLAAVVERGVTVGGIIYDPVGRDCTFALKGHGAWAKSESGVTRDIRVAKPTPACQHDRHDLVVHHAGTPAHAAWPPILPRSKPALATAVPLTNTASWPKGWLIFPCTTSSCPGTMRRAC